jgi:DNA-binding NarL/FixJ family response regulator
MPITVFIADDHPVMREGLTHLFHAQEDIRVVGLAANGRDAVQQVSQLHPNVFVADIAMPEMNGIEATRQIRERSPETQVVILSMHSTPDHIVHALETGARGYLLKENAGSEIVDAVRAVHAGKRYFCEKVTDILAKHVARRNNPNPIDSLSQREREILQLVAEGSSSIEIAGKLSLSPKTVDTYRSRLMQKLEIHDVAGLVKFSILHGLTTLD